MVLTGDQTMGSFGKYILAILTPWGRLSQTTYAVMILVLVAAHTAILMHLSGHLEDYPPYNPYSIGLIVILWMSFSVLSRRFHDCNSAALFLLPILIMTVAAYLVAFDHAALAESPFEEDRDLWTFVENIRSAFQLAGMAIILFALKSSGTGGENAYGAPFASFGSFRAQKPRLEKGAPAPVARTAKINPAAAPDKSETRLEVPVPRGPRGKIAPASLDRDRNGNFGRR